MDKTVKKKARWSERKLFYIFISPWLIGFVLLTMGPMVFSLFLSFTKWNMVGAIEWRGMGNYIDIFKDADFWQSVKVTLIWAAFLPVGIILAMFLSSLLNRGIRALPFFRTIIYIPTIVPAVANCLLWLWLFNPEYGMFNMLLNMVGLPAQNWLISTKTALLSLILMSLWQVGGNVVIFLAALQGVPKDMMEAAQIDGANSVVRYFRITIPMISPTIFFQLIMGIIGALQVFNQGYLMTEGGPLKSTLFYVLYLYNQAFVSRAFGYASALAWILFLFMLIITVLIFKTIGKKIYYEAN